MDYGANGVAAGMMDEAALGGMSPELQKVVASYEQLEPEEQDLFHAYVSGAVAEPQE